ncbi:hypothetical protein Golomagni_02317 [Golovinomyces magnicellulatus]|nr:hypothetical protein Golomagni_02317 [Golovinomyces magnicellulatus]
MVKKNRKQSSPITKRKLRKTLSKSNGRNQSRVDGGDESDSLFMTESPQIPQPSLPCEEIFKSKPDQKFRTKYKYDDFENYTESQLKKNIFNFHYFILLKIYVSRVPRLDKRRISFNFEYYILFQDTN